MKNTLNIRLAGMKFVFVNVSLILFCTHFLTAQEVYNQCSKALEVCPNVSVQVNNIKANVTVCTPCDDNFSTCFSPNNSIWLKFTTNQLGGATTIDFTNIIFEVGVGQDSEVQATLIAAASPCDGTTYTFLGNCVTNATSNFSLNANLQANKEYFIVLNGAKNGAGITKAAEFTTDVLLYGTGVDRATPVFYMNYDAAFCQAQVATFIAELSNCPDSSSFNWYINDTLAAVTVGNVFQTTKLKNNDVVKVTNSCFLQCPLEVVYESPPLFVTEFVVDAGPDKSIKFGNSVELNGFSQVPNYYWIEDNSLSNTTILNPVVNPDKTHTYYLVGEFNNCKITDEVTVFVSLELEITNTFSPNGDGANDFWEIPSLKEYPDCFVQIFDRWGQIVYTTTGYTDKKAWDGKRNGKNMLEGTYYYSIDLRDEQQRKITGYLNLVR